MRTVEEWVGKSDDSKIPPRVRTRIFLSKDGRCHRCKRKINTGEAWTCEHLIALINGGQNREANLDVTCNWCLPEKNAEDVAEKSRIYRKTAKHILPRRPSRLQGARFKRFAKQRSATRPLTKRIGVFDA